MKKRFLNIQELCITGVMTTILCIMAQITIPMPLGIPLTMQTFAIALAGIILGSKKGALCTLIYILIGGIGMPVFSNLTGGYQCLTGPTGGFILSFPLMTYCIGLGAEYQSRITGALPLGLILGNIINFLGGTAMYCLVTETGFIPGLAACVLPFLPTTIIKMWLAWRIGTHLRKHLPH